METSNIIVENLKCGGCANTIKTRLQSLIGIFSVEVDKENSAIKIEHNKGISRKEIIVQLEKLGYPEENTDNSIVLKAKSYVSCAIGRMSN